MITLRGNYRAGFKGGGNLGIGADAIPLQMGYVAGGGKTGDTIIIKMSDIINGGINMGVFVQAPGGATIACTLANPGSINPITGAGGIWSTDVTVPANVITQTVPLIFTAMKLTLTADGEFYVIAR